MPSSDRARTTRPLMVAVVLLVVFGLVGLGGFGRSAQAATANLVTNGGFESGLSGWTTTGTVATASSPTRTGSVAARGGSGAFSLRSGSISVPADATAASFQFWYYVETTTLDQLHGAVKDATTDQELTSGTYSSPGTTGSWRSYDANTSGATAGAALAQAIRGRTVYVEITLAHQSFNTAGQIVVDDVSLASDGGAPAGTSTGMGTSTGTATSAASTATPTRTPTRTLTATAQAAATGTATSTQTATTTRTATATFTVTRTPLAGGSVVGTGTAASCTETALASAVAKGGAITFDCGGAATIVLTRPIAARASATIDGGGAITLSGGKTTRFLTVDAGVDLTIANLTLRDGLVSDSAGGAVLNAGTLRLVNATLTGNTGLGGGAVHSYGTLLTVTESSFSGNTAKTTAGRGEGGAISANGGVVRITRSRFGGNSAYAGGAIRAFPATQMTVAGSTFQENTADNSGGAIESSGVLTVTGSTFVGNKANGSAAGGGAIAASGARTTIETTVIQGNSTAGDGGGLLTGGGSASVKDSTIAKNTAGNFGGGIENMFTTLTMSDSRITGNTADGGGGIHSSNKVDVTRSTIGDNTAVGDGGALLYNAFGVRSSIVDSAVRGTRRGTTAARSAWWRARCS